MISVSVADSHPDPDPYDPYVFGPPGSAFGSVRHRYGFGFGSGFGSESFHHQAKIVEETLISTVL
jgi:hypothetical protein